MVTTIVVLDTLVVAVDTLVVAVDPLVVAVPTFDALEKEKKSRGKKLIAIK